MNRPAVIGIGGWSGAGKTALASRLIPVVQARGYRVGCIKHAPHGFDTDRPGSDSARLTQAGADAVVVASPGRAALVTRAPADPALAELLAMLPDVDVVLVEGFHDEPIPRIEVAIPGRPLRCRPEHLIAVVTADEPTLAPNVPHVPPDDVDRIASLIVDTVRAHVGAAPP